MNKKLLKKNNQLSIDQTGQHIQSGLKISHPNKIIAGSKDVTKKQLIEYYDFIGDKMLPYIIERPLMILRCPGSEFRNCFYQKHGGMGLTKYIHLVDIIEKYKKNKYLMINDQNGLISLIQLGAVEIHPWGSTINNIEKPDLITFDLDPDPNVSWKKVIEAAKFIHQHLNKIDLDSFIKLSGGKGLHIVIPIKPNLNWDEIKQFAKAFADYMVSLRPNDFIATASKEKRGNKIFIDYLRNGRGSTSIAVYSTRAKENISISATLSWKELDKIKAAHEFNIKNIRARLSNQKKDPWSDYFKSKQTISKKLLNAFLKGQT